VVNSACYYVGKCGAVTYNVHVVWTIAAENTSQFSYRFRYVLINANNGEVGTPSFTTWKTLSGQTTYPQQTTDFNSSPMCGEAYRLKVTLQTSPTADSSSNYNFPAIACPIR
jgi:hypothetical protein